MEGDKVVFHSSDLPYEYLYDDEKHVSHMPDSKLSVRNILDSAYASAEGKIITRKLSRSIPPYPHAVRVKNGIRVYEYSEPRKQSYKSSLWKEAYNVSRNRRTHAGHFTCFISDTPPAVGYCRANRSKGTRENADTSVSAQDQRTSRSGNLHQVSAVS